MKKSALFCDQHEEVLAVERVVVTTLTGGRTHRDVCEPCYEEVITSLPAWFTVEPSSNGQRTRKRATRPKSKAQARDENERRDTKNRFVICNRCNEYVSLNNMSGHNTAWHNGAERDWREV